MKSVPFLLFAMFFTCASAFAAGEKLSVQIEKGKTPKTVILQLAGLENLRTQIAVQKANGHLCYAKEIKGVMSMTFTLNLKWMSKGDYILFVKSQNGTWTQTFSMFSDGISLFRKNSTELLTQNLTSFARHDAIGKGKLITYFTDEGGTSIGVKLANLQGHPAKIRIVSLGNDLVYEKTISGKNPVAQLISLKRPSDGSYFIYVQSVDATVVQFFTIKDKELTLEGLHRSEHPQNAPVNSSPLLTKN